MNNFIKTKLTTLRNDRRAVGAIEYALLASFLSLGIIAGATSLGSQISSYFTKLGTAIAGWYAT